jgi:hypothetical protein
MQEDKSLTYLYPISRKARRRYERLTVSQRRFQGM